MNRLAHHRLLTRPLSASRFVRWLTLLMQMVVVSGVPLPVGTLAAHTTMAADGEAVEGRLAAKDRSQPFPCMDRPCGCGSAEQCFSSCCCHTPEQLLAWARSRDLEAATLQLLMRRVREESPRENVGGLRELPLRTAGSCCEQASHASPAHADEGDTSCCDHVATPETPVLDCCTAAHPRVPAMTGLTVGEAEDICSDYASLATEPRPRPVAVSDDDGGPSLSCCSPSKPDCCGLAERPPATSLGRTVGAAQQQPAPEALQDGAHPQSPDDSGNEPPRQTVILSAMLACGGLIAEWFAGGVVLVPPLEPVASGVPAAAGVVLLRDEVAEAQAPAPDLPPPRA